MLTTNREMPVLTGCQKQTINLIIMIITRTPKIFTSYYSGRQIGKSISIYYPPKECKFEPLPLFTPSEELVKVWKKSKKDKEAQKTYISNFRKELEANRHLIDVWIKRIDSEYITLNGEPGEFSHRHVLKKYLPEDMWQGEIEDSNVISVADASWSQIFDNRWRIIFDNRPIKVA